MDMIATTFDIAMFLSILPDFQLRETRDGYLFGSHGPPAQSVK
jgi:hypothetical protein